MSSPAEIIRQFLMDNDLGTDPDLGEAWPIFVSFLPASPDNAICIYDTMGQQDGRIMTGEQIIHPGIQIFIRGPDYPTTWGKVGALATALDMQRRSVVTVDAEHSYCLQNVSRTGDILSLGLEQSGDRRRHQMVINALVTFAQL